MTTPYWIEVEPISSESERESKSTPDGSDSESDFHDSGIFSGCEEASAEAKRPVRSVSASSSVSAQLSLTGPPNYAHHTETTNAGNLPTFGKLPSDLQSESVNNRPYSTSNSQWTSISPVNPLTGLLMFQNKSRSSYNSVDVRSTVKINNHQLTSTPDSAFNWYGKYSPIDTSPETVYRSDLNLRDKSTADENIASGKSEKRPYYLPLSVSGSATTTSSVVKLQNSSLKTGVGRNDADRLDTVPVWKNSTTVKPEYREQIPSGSLKSADPAYILRHAGRPEFRADLKIDSSHYLVSTVPNQLQSNYLKQKTRSVTFIPESLNRKFREKTQRKQAYPRRSPESNDPNFRGVVLKFRIRLMRKRQHKLVVKSLYSCFRRTKRCRHHRHFPRNNSCYSSDEADSDTEIRAVRYYTEGKQCASCSTKKTPLWRDGEDGTPLCNACGIRYKKYRVRCVTCWYVPRKANKSCPVCLHCGDRVQQTYHNRRIFLP